MRTDTTRLDESIENVRHALATPSAFRSWLEDKTDTETVGYCLNVSQCPIARFVQTAVRVPCELTGLHCEILGHKETLTPDFNGCDILAYVPLYPWAREFVSELDASVEDYNLRSNFPVSPVVATAEECLEILRHIP